MDRGVARGLERGRKGAGLQPAGRPQDTSKGTGLMDKHLQAGNAIELERYAPQHFAWEQQGAVGVITLNRPERKNPLTFESYAELCELFRGLPAAKDVKVVIITGAGGNFCSGGDVHEIIGPLTRMGSDEL